MKEQKPRTKIVLGKLYRGHQYQKSYHDIFASVASLYAEFRERIAQGAISSCDVDPDSRKPLRPDLAINWLIDCENAIERACKTLAMEHAALQLLKEANGEGKAEISNGLRYSTIQAIGRELERRGLVPIKRYFVSQKRRRERGE